MSVRVRYMAGEMSEGESEHRREFCEDDNDVIDDSLIKNGMKNTSDKD